MLRKKTDDLSNQLVREEGATHLLGSVLQDQGDLNGAKAAFERALRIFKKFLPEEHPNIKLV